MNRRFLAALPAVAAIALCLGATSARAETLLVDLTGGGSKNNSAPALTPFTGAAIDAMTDGNNATGFTHTSLFGADFGNQISGIQERFDFDVSEFASITQITFSWTGRHEWAGSTNPFPQLRLGYEPGAPLTNITFGSGGQSDTVVRSGSATFTAGGSGFSNLALVLDGDVASLWVATSFGVSSSPVWQSISVETLEVTATVTGTLAPPVPEPATLSLLAIGAAITGRRFGRRTARA